MKKIFKFDEKRAFAVITTLLDAKKNKKQIFARADALQPYSILPKGMERGSKEHALYLFAMMFFDHNIKSDILYMNGRKVFEKEPLFFKPNVAINLPSKVDEIIKNDLHYKFLKGIEGFLDNYRKLSREYDGDPREIFNEKDVIRGLKEIQKFNGYGPGLGSQLVCSFIEGEIVDFKNKEDLPPKIDIHDIRISIGTGILKTKKKKIHKGRVISGLADFYQRFCREKSLDLRAFDSALWILGSKVCTKKNYSCQLDCPIEGYCVKLVSSYYEDGFIHLDVNKKSPQPGLKLK